MPLHDFQCGKCGKITEALVDSDEHMVTCTCDHFAHKIMSAGSFRINGHSEANGYNWCGDGPVYKS